MTSKCVNCTVGAKCSNCGQCCIPWLPITKKEYATIKKYIEDNNIQPERLEEDDKLYFDCCFHDRKNHKCKIYEVRPEVCKAFSCHYNAATIDKNRKYYDKRAYYNGNNIHRFYPMDYLFYNDPTILIYFCMYALHCKTAADIKKALITLGHKDMANSFEIVND